MTSMIQTSSGLESLISATFAQKNISSSLTHHVKCTYLILAHIENDREGKVLIIQETKPGISMLKATSPTCCKEDSIWQEDQILTDYVLVSSSLVCVAKSGTFFCQAQFS